MSYCLRLKLFSTILLIALIGCGAAHSNLKNYIDDFSTFSNDSVVNMVVEIPAGTDQKWEVRKDNGQLAWDVKDGKPRIIQYLAYPFNYGMIPQTKLPKELGGDGDPLDVIALGATERRGSVVRVRPIGVLKLIDSGERDDKIIAVKIQGPLSEISSLQELEIKYPGIKTIIETWLVNYKGQGRMVSEGFDSSSKARSIVEEANSYYRRQFGEK